MTFLDRTRFWWLVAIPWVALYYVAASLGIAPHSFHPELWFEPLPVLPWTCIFYFSEYLVVASVPLLRIRDERFRDLIVQCWISIAIAFLFYFTLPAIAPRPPVPRDAFLGHFLSWERGNYPASVAFPSFHVIWAVLIANAAATGSKLSRRAWWTWAIAVCLSCVTTGMHWITDVAAGAVVCLLATRHEAVWAWCKANLPAPGCWLAAVALAMIQRRLWALNFPLHWTVLFAIAAAAFVGICVRARRRPTC